MGSLGTVGMGLGDHWGQRDGFGIFGDSEDGFGVGGSLGTAGMFLGDLGHRGMGLGLGSLGRVGMGLGDHWGQRDWVWGWGIFGQGWDVVG